MVTDQNKNIGVDAEAASYSTMEARSGTMVMACAGWLSPIYVRSQTVQLDVKQVESNRCIGLLPGGADSERYKMVRVQIGRQMLSRGWNTLMVTSVHPGEGKTVTAINLAAVIAKEYGQTSLLVDADLRAQTICRYLGYNSTHGLADYLLGECSVEEIIAWPQVEKLTIISGGRRLADTAEALSSPRMNILVQEMKNRYADRFIIFDVPPLLGRADAMAFASVVDAIVIVVAAGRTPLPDIHAALALIPQEKLLGFIMNRGT